MRPLTIQLENFRAFRTTGEIPVRPLTFLVGQNSTGKTSFLAALNFLLQFQEGDSNPSFSREPFDLGSFEQISHRVGTRARAGSFRLSLSTEINVNDSNSLLAIIWSDNPGTKEPEYRACTLNVHFENVFGSAEITSVVFAMGDEELRMRLYPSPHFEVELSDVVVQFTPERELPFNVVYSSEGIFSPRSLTYLLNQAGSSWRQSEDSRSPKNAGVSRLVRSFGVFLNSLPDNVYAGAPIRSTPERVYSASERGEAPDGRSTPYKLRRAKLADKARWERLKGGFEEFGELSGLFSKFDIARLTREEAGPFQINVRIGKRKSSIADVGYGVSQTLPIITDLIEAPHPSSFLFQQPEVHLHPRAQAGLGTFFSRFAAQHLDSCIVVETHSDFLIDRVRHEVRQGTLSSEAVSLLYFEEKQDRVEIHHIGLDRYGNVVAPPRCYRDFFFREQLTMLNLGDDEDVHLD